MVKFLMWVVIIIAFVALCIYGMRILKFVVKRLWFAFRLFIMSTFCKGFEYCYKAPWSIFAGRKNKYSDVLVYYGGTIYIIKFCGFFQKLTDVVVGRGNTWQVITYFARGWWYFLGSPNVKTETVSFDLPRERELFENNVWSVPNISQINTLMLLLPKPRSFGVHVETRVEWLASGNMCGGNIVGTVRYFWRTLKELKEESEDFMYIEKDQWEIIKREYKKAKWN